MYYELAAVSEDQGEQVYETDYWQQIGYKSDQESSTIWEKQAHWHKVSLSEKSNSKWSAWSCSLQHSEVADRCADQSSQNWTFYLIEGWNLCCWF